MWIRLHSILHSGSIWASALPLLLTLLPAEDRKIDRIRHRLITRVVRVQVVAGVELRANFLRVARVARRRFEIHHRVERAAGSYPGIQRPADRFAILSGVSGAAIRRQRAADRLDAVRVRLVDDLLVRANQLIG